MSDDPSSNAVDDIQCTWRGGVIDRMEWLFVGNSTIIPMDYTNTSWNDEVVECRVQEEILHFKVKGKLLNFRNK